MKRVITSVVLMGMMAGVGPLTSAAHADDPFAPQPGYRLRAPGADLDRQQATNLKRSGIAVSILGTSLAIAGAAVLGSARNNHPGEWSDANNVGVALGVMGLGGLTAGVPMWVIGANAERRNGVVRVAFAPNGAGGTF